MVYNLVNERDEDEKKIILRQFSCNNKLRSSRMGLGVILMAFSGDQEIGRNY